MPINSRAMAASRDFFFDLELLELNATIAQAAPRGVAKY
jgi:hypothetical protein